MIERDYSIADVVEALNRLTNVVNNHAEHIRWLGERLNDHEQAIMLIHGLIERKYGQPEPQKPLVLHLIEHGDNVVSHPKFRDRQP